ncbi:MAG: hypothetical protein IJ566_01960 [Cardiobacteriaceae bacterium]|nr:hypothetical protein [Cardiobacteriaceae bacterium]
MLYEIYFLSHPDQNKYNSAEKNTKIIGIYSSIEEIDKAIDQFHKQGNFLDNPNDFIIEKYELDKSYWQTGFILDKNIPVWADKKVVYTGETSYEFAYRLCSEYGYDKEFITWQYSEYASLVEYAKTIPYVYILWHYYETENYDDVIKLLGIFSSYELAKEAEERCKKLPGFKSLPYYFDIDAYQINQMQWTEGFGLEFSDEEQENNKITDEEK